MPRHTFLVSAAVCLLVGGLGRTAAAKDCTTDADCYAGYQCNIPQVVTISSPPAGGASGIGYGAATGSSSGGVGGAGGSVATDGGAAPQSSPDAGLLSPIPVPSPAAVGTCEAKPIVCTTVADCPSADFDCELTLLPTPAPTCAPGIKCATPPSQTASTGTCVAKPRACTSATDCPAPLVCAPPQSNICGQVDPTGTSNTSASPCVPGPSVCTWTPEVCKTDGDCSDARYLCVKVSESSWCTGSSGGCAAGTTCPAPPPPTCGTNVVMNCLPKLVDCAAGQICPTGWSCFDFSNQDGIPPAWGSVPSNKACLPEGIILATQGHAAGTSPSMADSSPPAGGGGTTGTVTVGLDHDAGVGAGPAKGAVAPSPANGSPEGASAPTADAGATTKAVAQSSGGCALGGSDANAFSLSLALALIGLYASRIRRQVRVRTNR